MTVEEFYSASNGLQTVLVKTIIIIIIRSHFNLEIKFLV